MRLGEFLPTQFALSASDCLLPMRCLRLTPCDFAFSDGLDCLCARQRRADYQSQQNQPGEGGEVFHELTG